MACINADGTITESARKLLDSLKTPKRPEEIARILEEPLYKVRSSLREMSNSGFIAGYKEEYVLTDKGKEVVSLN